MQTLYQNQQTVWYANYDKSTTAYDSDGNISGENVSYTTPVATRMHVSLVRGSIDSSRGRAHLNEYGIDEGYVATLMTDDMECPITETSVLWIKRGAYDGNGNLTPYDFVVYRKLPTLNSVTFICKEVDVG